MVGIVLALAGCLILFKLSARPPPALPTCDHVFCNKVERLLHKPPLAPCLVTAAAITYPTWRIFLSGLWIIRPIAKIIGLSVLLLLVENSWISQAVVLLWLCLSLGAGLLLRVACGRR
jgi:hypothetical protein